MSDADDYYYADFTGTPITKASYKQLKARKQKKYPYTQGKRNWQYYTSYKAGQIPPKRREHVRGLIGEHTDGMIDFRKRHAYNKSQNYENRRAFIKRNHELAKARLQTNRNYRRRMQSQKKPTFPKFVRRPFDNSYLYGRSRVFIKRPFNSSYLNKPKVVIVKRPFNTRYRMKSARREAINRRNNLFNLRKAGKIGPAKFPIVIRK